MINTNIETCWYDTILCKLWIKRNNTSIKNNAIILNENNITADSFKNRFITSLFLF